MKRNNLAIVDIFIGDDEIYTILCECDQFNQLVQRGTMGRPARVEHFYQTWFFGWRWTKSTKNIIPEIDKRIRRGMRMLEEEEDRRSLCVPEFWGYGKSSAAPGT